MIDAPSGRWGMDGGHGVHDADQVHVGGVHEVHGVRGAHGHDPGVGHDDVEVAELADTLFEDRLQLVPVANIGLAGDDPAAVVLDRLRRLFQILRRGQRVQVGLDLLADVDGDDVGALLGEADGMAAALSACRSGDERNFPFEPTCHENLQSLSGPKSKRNDCFRTNGNTADSAGGRQEVADALGGPAEVCSVPGGSVAQSGARPHSSL